MNIYSKQKTSLHESLCEAFNVHYDADKIIDFDINIESLNENSCVGELNPFYGKKHTEEWKQQASRRNMGSNNSQYGISKTIEIKRKQSDFMKNNNPMKDPEIVKKFSASRTGTKRKKETVEKIAESLAKTWIVTSPSGEIYFIKNLNKFCRENGLDTSNLHAVSTGRKKHHKGWKCCSGTTTG
jgi:hypothetical protein